MEKLITSESVAYGHPDKISDQISDALLDLHLAKDPDAKVAIETMVKDNHVIVGGEVETSADITEDEFRQTIEMVYRDLNFPESHGLNPDNITIIDFIGKQSPEINSGVTSGELGAGDQGFMTGYATNETKYFMPLGMYLSKKILDTVLKLEGLGPDAKSQVTIDNSDVPSIHNVLLSTMHVPEISLTRLREELDPVIREAITHQIKQGGEFIHAFYRTPSDMQLHINPAGAWNMGGPVSDCGLTGRKIVVDQYGPYCPVGGGAYSGKDGTKVDRSASYLCRYIAKNLVAAKIYDRVKVEIAYMIGMADPVGFNVYGVFPNGLKGGIRDRHLDALRQIFPMKPLDIINHFGLKEPIFYDTARFGHYGYDKHPWEQLDKVEEVKAVFASSI